jgi:hypothetical protein
VGNIGGCLAGIWDDERNTAKALIAAAGSSDLKEWTKRVLDMIGDL